MSGLFKSKKQAEPTINKIYDPFEGLRGSLSSFLEGEVGKSAKSYTGDFVAPESAAEKRSLNFLDDYANGPGTGESFKLAKDEVRKTLTNEYDPSTSPYYQAVKAATSRNQEKALERAEQTASMGRRYYGGGRLKQQGDIITDTTNSLNLKLGEMAETERGRRLQAVPMAAELDKYESESPLRKTAALQEYGSLPRQLQQAYLDAVYNEFLSSTREYPLNIAQLATGLSAKEPIFTSTGAPKKKAESENPLGFLSTLFNFL